MNQRLSKQALEALNTELSLKIEPLFEFLEIDIDEFSFYDDQIRGPAPCHGGKNKTGFSIELDSGRWACWTAECHKQHGTDIIGLIRAITELPFSQVLEKVKIFLSDNTIDAKRIEELRAEREEKRKCRQQNIWKDHVNPIRVYPEECLSRLIVPETFAEERYLPLEVLRSYGIGYATKGPMWDRIVIPIRNINGKIVGFSGRKVNYDPDRDIKWFHYKKGEFRKGIHLFNLDRVFKGNHNTYILVEGPLDVLKLEAAGIHNSVAVLGRSITNGQIEVLRKVGAMKILVAFDADKRGSEGTESVLQKLGNNLFDSGIIDLKSAYPNWNDKKCGGLDWANRYVSINRIQQIIKDHTYV